MQHQCLINDIWGNDNNDGIQDPVKTEARAKEILEATGDHIVVQYADGDNFIARIRRDIGKTLGPKLAQLCDGDPGALMEIKSIISAIDKDVREHETHVHNSAFSAGTAHARKVMRQAYGLNDDGTIR